MRSKLIAIVGLCLIPAGIVLAQPAATPDVTHENRRAEMRERMIKAIDADSDGRISQAEYLKRAEERFQKLDVNSDGFVTSEELEQRHAEWRQKRAERGEKRGHHHRQ
ncbi:MAG: hypothetical protein KIT81_11945 [Alphaproteobacteria bacterium]|nr:hypothetical protein [Alphaproteobacteria bacterium]